MATTDSNGIVFLEETDPISPFHTTMNTLQQGTSDAIDAVREEIGDGSGDNIVIHYVADTAARGLLATAYSPSASKPLYVYRGNATAGEELEVTEDGSTWSVHEVKSDTGWVNITSFGSTFESLSGYTLQVRRVGKRVSSRGLLKKTTSWSAGTAYAGVLTLPAGFAPSGPILYVTLPANTAGQPPAVALLTSTGSVDVRTGATVAAAGYFSFGGVDWYVD